MAEPVSTCTYVTPYGCSYDDGKPMFFEESALIELLAAGVLLMSGGYKSESDTIEVVVNCNDLFYWGTADAEPCGPDELQGLYNRWKADPIWGVKIWCCIHRNLQPQAPICRKMQVLDAWTDELAALPMPKPT